MLAFQGNNALKLKKLNPPRLEQALRLQRDVYSGYLKQNGEEHLETLRAANNLAVTLNDLKRFEEVKAFLRKTIPVARRVLGESHGFMMRWTYATALYRDPNATLRDLRESVATLEDAWRIARRVLGGAHPHTTAIEAELRDARAAPFHDGVDAPRPEDEHRVGADGYYDVYLARLALADARERAEEERIERERRAAVERQAAAEREAAERQRQAEAAARQAEADRLRAIADAADARERAERLRSSSRSSESTPDDETTSRCVICMASQSDHLCIPCGHVVFCGSCARDPRLEPRCPVCRLDVEDVQRVEARPRGAAVAGDRPESAARAAAASDTKYLPYAAATLAAAAAVLVLRKRRIT